MRVLKILFYFSFCSLLRPGLRQRSRQEPADPKLLLIK